MVKKTVLRYSLLFVLISGIVFLPFIAAGELFVYSGDGTTQHVPFMGFYGKWLRDSVSAVLEGRAISLYSHVMGHGSDILYALNWYGMGDPLCLLYGLLPSKYILTSYTAINILRLYLAGLAMVFLVKRFGKLDRFSPVIGVCYAFSAFAFTLGLLRHPFFINPLIQLPLLLIGIDKILKHESPIPFILVVAWTALCGYYYLYMCCIFLFIFACIRHIYLEKDVLRTLPGNFVKSIFYFLIGICIAAPIFVPACVGFLNSGRAGDMQNLNLFSGISPKYYFTLPYNLLSKFTSGACLPAILWLGFAIALFRKDENRGMRLALSGCALMMILFPVFNSLMNGFSYSTNRWTFGLSALIVFVGGSGLKSLTNLSVKQRRAVDGISLMAVIYFGFAFSTIIWKNRSNLNLDVLESAAYPGFVTASFLCSWIVIRWINRPHFERRHNAQSAKAVFLVVALLFNIVAVDYLWLIPRITTETYRSPAEMHEKIYEASPLNSALFDGNAFTRVDADAKSFTHSNDSITTGIPSTVFYNSTIASEVYESVNEMSLPMYMCNFLNGLNGRAALEALWSVTHYVRKVADSEQYPIPYGFELIESDGIYEWYRNNLALPFGYTTDAYAMQTEYDAASPVEKQWMLLQGATLPMEDPRLKHNVAQCSYDRPALTIECSEGVQWGDNRLIAPKNGWMRIQFNGTRDSETYLELTGLHFEKYSGNEISWRLSGDAADYTVRFSTPAHNQQAKQSHFLIQMGYAEAPQREITITFNQEFTARVEDICLVCQPMTSFEEYIHTLGAEAMENVAFDANRISGDCTVSRDSILVLSLPYSSGWQACVDGEPTELFPSGTVFTAMKLSEGAHTIELKYHTPGLRAGNLAFLFGIVALAAIIFQKRRQRSGNPPSDIDRQNRFID